MQIADDPEYETKGSTSEAEETASEAQQINETGVHPVQVDGNGAFELLCADCLRDEPFPREIQVIGQAIGWADKIKVKARNRGWDIEIKVKKVGKNEEVQTQG